MENNKKPKISDMIATTLEKVREMASANTIIGEAMTTPEGVTIIPVSKLTCGFGAGGSDYNTRHNSNQVLFGGGGGAGIDLTPISFIIIANGNVEILPAAGTVATPAPETNIISTIDKVVDGLPGIVEKLQAFFAKQKEKKAEEKETEQTEE